MSTLSSFRCCSVCEQAKFGAQRIACRRCHESVCCDAQLYALPLSVIADEENTVHAYRNKEGCNAAWAFIDQANLLFPDMEVLASSLKKMWCHGASLECKESVVGLLLAQIPYESQLLLAKFAPDTFGDAVQKLGSLLVTSNLPLSATRGISWLERLKRELELSCDRTQLPAFWLTLRECVRLTLSLDCESVSTHIAQSFSDSDAMIGLDLRSLGPVAIRALRGFFVSALKVLNGREFGQLAGRALVKMNLQKSLVKRPEDEQEEAMVFARVTDVQEEYTKLLSHSILSDIAQTRNAIDRKSPIKSHLAPTLSSTLSEPASAYGGGDSDSQSASHTSSCVALSRSCEGDNEADDSALSDMCPGPKRMRASFWGQSVQSDYTEEPARKKRRRSSDSFVASFLIPADADRWYDSDAALPLGVL